MKGICKRGESMENNRKSNNFKMMLKQPFLLFTIISIFVMLGIFILLPLYNVFKLSFRTDNGGFSLQAFKDIITNKSYQYTFLNSMKLGVLVALIATFMGYIFAFAITRTEMNIVKANTPVSPDIYQPKLDRSAKTKTTGTKYPEIISAIFAIGALDP